MEIKIRPAEIADFDQIFELFKAFAEFEKIPEKMVNSVERMNNEKEFFHCFVAETENREIVGYTTYFFTYFTFVGKSLYMDDLFVKEGYRSHGIGTKLINEMISFAKREQCHKLRWQVSAWNTPAIEFYKSLGALIDRVEQNCDLILD